MRRSTLFVGILSLLHATDLVSCEDDEVTLLQLNKRVQAHPWTSHAKSLAGAKSALPRAEALLASVRQLAQHATGENPEVVNTAIEAVKDALAQMQPKIIEEHDLVQSEIQRQLAEIQACHTSEGHGATVVTTLVGEIGTIQDCRDAVDGAVSAQTQLCEEWENHAQNLVFPPCLSSTDSQQIYGLLQNMHGWVVDAWPTAHTMYENCQQATGTADDERARCEPVIARYDEVFCQHFLSCRLLSACHHHEVEVYNAMRDDSLAGQTSRQDQWRIVKQAECILDHITGSVSTNDTIGDASLSSCDDNIDVSHLVLNFPEPEHWPECPNPNAGDPQCPPVQLPEGWTGGVGDPSAPPIVGGDLCVPLLENYRLENLQNAGPAHPLNAGTFSYIKAVWKSGHIACNRGHFNDYRWQTCCSSGYSSGCGASFELVQNGHNIIEQPGWSQSAPQCDQPESPTGDLICHQRVTVSRSDNLIATWYETNRRTSLGDNEVDLVVDLFGCTEGPPAPPVTQPGCHPLLQDYHLSNLQDSPPAHPLSSGSFSFIKAVWKSGHIACNSGHYNDNRWQTCCSGGYSSGCGASFELVQNDQLVLAQPGWSQSAPQCDQPSSGMGDLICHQPLTISTSDDLTVTWYETHRQTSLGDNAVDLVVDLFGCIDPPPPPAPTEPGCYPILNDYALSNLQNSPALHPVNVGSFSSIKAVYKSGHIACNSGHYNDYRWQTCCSGGYSSSCGASLEVVQNGRNVIEQPGWSTSAPQCDQPSSPTGDILCHQPLEVGPSDNFIVTWYETNRQVSLGDNAVDLVVDLLGCIDPAPSGPVTEPGCYPLLHDYQLSNLQNSPPAHPVNSGSFNTIRAVWRSGRIACNRGHVTEYSWQTCCGGGYSSGCGASFELVQNGVNVIEQPGWSQSAPQCHQPSNPKGDLNCDVPLTIAASDDLIVTWYETNRQTSLGDNEVDLVVDLFGCI